MTVIKKIEESLNKIRPGLQADGGDVELVNFDADQGLVLVKLRGVCAHCPMSEMTLQQGIAAQLKNDVPEVKRVEAVS